MSATVIAMLRVVHILAGAFWLGVVLMSAGWLLPAVRASGPAGGQVMKEIVQVRRLPAFLNAAVVCVLVTGAVLLWWASGGLAAAWLASGPGIGLSLGSVLALAAAALGLFVNAPTARRIGQLAAAAQTVGGPPSATVLAQLQQMHQRLFNATRLAALLLVLATAAMAAARYAL